MVRHLDQADNYDCAISWVGVLNSLAKSFVVGVRFAVELAMPQRIRMFGRPFFQPTSSKEVAVVLQQLLQTAAGHVGQLDLEFLRSAEDLMSAHVRWPK